LSGHGFNAQPFKTQADAFVHKKFQAEEVDFPRDSERSLKVKRPKKLDGYSTVDLRVWNICCILIPVAQATAPHPLRAENMLP